MPTLEAIRQQLERTQQRLASRPLQAAIPLGPVWMAPVELIHVRPAVFQFRMAQTQAGTCGRLRAVPHWNQSLAGALLVWRDSAGDLNLVDGHHRLELARRDGVAQVAVLEIQAPDPEEARLIGAVANVAAGQADAPELARLLRAQPELTPTQLSRDYGLSRLSRAVQDAALLRALDDQLFADTACGLVPLDHALALCSVDHPLQRQLWSHAQRRGWDAPQLQEAAELSRGGSTTAQPAVAVLPGLEKLMAEGCPHLDQLLAVRARVRKALRLEHRTTKAVANGQAAALLEHRGVAAVDVAQAAAVKAEAATLLEIFGRLAGCSGPLAAALNRLAQLVADGQDLGRVVEENMPEIRSILAAELS